MPAGGTNDAAEKRLRELAKPREDTGCTDLPAQQVLSIACSIDGDSASRER